MIRAKDGNGCCTSWCCCIRQQIAELRQRIEGTVRGVKMNGNIIEPDGDGIVDLDVNFPVDGAMDPTSTNPVQNRVVTDAILTERNERIEDDRRHDLQIQGLQTEVATKLTTPSGGVQGQVLGKGAQGIEWVDQQGGSGGAWEPIDMSNWPTDWEVGDRVRMIVDYPIQASGTRPDAWTTAPTGKIFTYNSYKTAYMVEWFYNGYALIAQPTETNPSNIPTRKVTEIIQVNLNKNDGSLNGFTVCYNGGGFIKSSIATSTDTDESKRITVVSAVRLRPS